MEFHFWSSSKKQMKVRQNFFNSLSKWYEMDKVEFQISYRQWSSNPSPNHKSWDPIPLQNGYQ